MKSLKNVFFVGVVALVSSCNTSDVALKPAATYQASSSREDSLTQALHEEVNRYRVSKGLKPLAFHRGLAKLAKPHSDYMRQRAGSSQVGGKKSLVSHYGFEARKTLAEKKYRIESINENVIASYGLGQDASLAAKIVRGWQSSEDQLHNLNSTWSSTGIAVSFDDQDRVFATQIYGTAPSKGSKVGTPSAAW